MNLNNLSLIKYYFKNTQFILSKQIALKQIKKNKQKKKKTIIKKST